MLRIESSKEHLDLRIPSFLNVIREVTHDQNYVGIKMIDQNWKMPVADKKAIKEGSPKKENPKKILSES